MNLNVNRKKITYEHIHPHPQLNDYIDFLLLSFFSQIAFNDQAKTLHELAGSFALNQSFTY